jgi:mannose-1-phosphate guanylyltransferase
MPGIPRKPKAVIQKAFLLGAGLGTRLRPLTDLLPKPLVPLFHRPLIEWAMEACVAAGAREFAINTHHLPERWKMMDGGWRMDGETAIPGENGIESSSGSWNGLPVHLFHEPELLETGGGIWNISRWIGDDPVLVHNGDVYSSIDLNRLVAAHEASGDVVTLALRSEGPAKVIALEGDWVVDIRGLLGRAPGTHLFTGIYVFSPELLKWIPPGEKITVRDTFVELAKAGRLGSVTLDGGQWMDLGDLASYLEAHRQLSLAEPIHAEARISPQATVIDSVVGPGAEIGDGATVERSVIWPGASVAAGQVVADAVVTTAGVVI